MIARLMEKNKVFLALFLDNSKELCANPRFFVAAPPKEGYNEGTLNPRGDAMRRMLSRIVTVCLCLLMLQAPPSRALTADLTTGEKAALLSALYEAEIPQLRQAIDLGVISCRELTEYCLDRIETYNDAYNCFITLFDDALEQAEARDEQLRNGTAKGSLFGIPVVVKDNIHVAGWPTTNGYAGKNTPAAKNAEIVDSLLAEGAVLLGKTNMSTGAQDARVSRSAAAGETKNAYCTWMASGGSSGGSAVAVSLNFAPAGLGTDTNSSLRMPAALNGCVSLRSTTKTLSTEGIVKLNGSRDVPGVITRTVTDQAILLDVISGGATAYARNLNPDALKEARIGVLEELSYPREKGERREKYCCPEVAAAFAAAVEELKLCGAEVVPVSMPNLFELAEATLCDGGWRSIPRYTAAFEAFLAEQELDAVVFPTYLSVPQRSGTDETGKKWLVDTQVFINNCRMLAPSAAVPEITVPIGTHSLGAGIGMEIAAAQGQEQLLLDLAYGYTTRFDHRTVPAGAPDRYAFAHAGDLGAWLEAYLAPESALQARPLAAEEPPAEQEPAGNWLQRLLSRWFG